MRGMSDVEGFFTFDSLGRGLNGYANAAKELLLSPLSLASGVGNLASDAWGYSKDALYGPERDAFGYENPYQAENSLVQSIQTRGVLGTIGGLTIGVMKSLPLISTIDGLSRGDAYMVGGSLPNLAMAAFGVANSAEAGSLAARMERIAARTPEEIADRARVAALINKARAQGDPGVPQLISQLERNGITVKDTNHYMGNPSREVDIETSTGTLLQVKNCRAHKR